MSRSLEQLKELSLAENLGRCFRLWRTVADMKLAPLGLTQPRWTALWKLRRLGDHVSQKSLAEALEIELPSLTRTLSHLEEAGLISRRPSTRDKRERLVALTSSGRELIASIEDRIVRIRKELLEGISESELEQFEQTLARITDNACRKLAER